jgi:hypothetical protein
MRLWEQFISVAALSVFVGADSAMVPDKHPGIIHAYSLNSMVSQPTAGQSRREPAEETQWLVGF